MSDAVLRRRWAALEAAGRVALVPYLTAGFPSRDTSVAALQMAQEAGADFIEIGIPFSDPLADGPIIQRSTQHALDSGMTVGGALDLVREAALDVPVIAFGYLNPILAYGVSRFLADAASAGVAGLLITDLPLGEDPSIETAVRDSALALIPLVAPTTPVDTLSARLVRSEGFVYVIARLGVTGARTALDASVERLVANLRAATTLPVVLGFGIQDGDQAARVAQFADGVVVGSALVERLETGLDAARALLTELRDALDRVPASRRG